MTGILICIAWKFKTTVLLRVTQELNHHHRVITRTWMRLYIRTSHAYEVLREWYGCKYEVKFTCSYTSAINHAKDFFLYILLFLRSWVHHFLLYLHPHNRVAVVSSVTLFLLVEDRLLPLQAKMTKEESCSAVFMISGCLVVNYRNCSGSYWRAEWHFDTELEAAKEYALWWSFR